MIVIIKLLNQAGSSLDRKLNLGGSSTQARAIWKLERTARPPHSFLVLLMDSSLPLTKSTYPREKSIPPLLI